MFVNQATISFTSFTLTPTKASHVCLSKTVWYIILQTCIEMWNGNDLMKATNFIISYEEGCNA
jgi:hypothetical protein